METFRSRGPEPPNDIAVWVQTTCRTGLREIFESLDLNRPSTSLLPTSERSRVKSTSYGRRTQHSHKRREWRRRWRPIKGGIGLRLVRSRHDQRPRAEARRRQATRSVLNGIRHNWESVGLQVLDSGAGDGTRTRDVQLGKTLNIR